MGMLFVPPPPEFRVVCAWCRKDLGGTPDAPNVSHGICPECLAREMAGPGLTAVQDELDRLDNQPEPKERP